MPNLRRSAGQSRGVSPAILFAVIGGFSYKGNSMAKGTRLAPEQGFAPIEGENYARGFHSIAGIDEVGRGPLAGPVVAAAVILPRDFDVEGIKDSKLLTPSQRERLAPIIKAKSISWSVGVVDVHEIDRFNILKATLMAMARACRALAPAPDHLLIDGRETIPASLLKLPRLSYQAPLRQTALIKGDRICLSIAAASILAKVARDQIMVELDSSYPQYGFALHKGYGSAAHLAALRRYGPSPVHRRTFAQVREFWEMDLFARQ
jgi:ribonuclease HII